MINALRPDDWKAVRAIYEEGIATGLATFEIAAPTWEDWDNGHLVVCRLAIRSEMGLAGWDALSPISRRKAYAGVAEASIYIASWARGQGLGKKLLTQLITDSERAGIWTLQSTIFAINSASRSLHLSCGFREVGYRERIAQRDGAWLDTVILERRSAVVGT